MLNEERKEGRLEGGIWRERSKGRKGGRQGAFPWAYHIEGSGWRGEDRVLGWGGGGGSFGVRIGDRGRGEERKLWMIRVNKPCILPRKTEI